MNIKKVVQLKQLCVKLIKKTNLYKKSWSNKIIISVKLIKKQMYTKKSLSIKENID